MSKDEPDEATELVAVEQEAWPQQQVPLSPQQVVDNATAEAVVLAQVIEDRNLYVAMGHDRKTGEERRYVNVEGWQTLGAMRGLATITEWTRRTDPYQPLRTSSKWVEDPQSGKRRKETTTEQEGIGGWEARVQLVNAEGRVIGAAEAECTWDEEVWGKRESNALRSMAQTRAIGKVYRGVFAFVMALAGYVTTPAEEMPVIPNVADLHAVPEGVTVPEAWAKQVALVLANGNATAAAELYANGVAQVVDPDADDAAQPMSAEGAEALVVALHELALPSA